MRKLPSELDNPIDTMILNLGENIIPFFKSLNFTPNDLTTISLITGLYAFKKYNDSSYWQSAIFFLVSYVFDCLDGNYARRYNMVTKFGDYYDHVKDIVVAGLLGFMIWKKYSMVKGNSRYLPYIIILLLFLSCVQLGCQEEYFDSSDSGSLDITRCLCPSRGMSKQDIHNSLKITRHFGTGTLTFYIIFIILFSYKIDNMVEKGE